MLLLLLLHQLCLTLYNPIDGSPPGSPAAGILQARTMEWVAIAFSRDPLLYVEYLSPSQILHIPSSITRFRATPSMKLSIISSV